MTLSIIQKSWVSSLKNCNNNEIMDIINGCNLSKMLFLKKACLMHTINHYRVICGLQSIINHNNPPHMYNKYMPPKELFILFINIIQNGVDSSFLNSLALNTNCNDLPIQLILLNDHNRRVACRMIKDELLSKSDREVNALETIEAIYTLSSVYVKDVDSENSDTQIEDNVQNTSSNVQESVGVSKSQTKQKDSNSIDIEVVSKLRFYNDREIIEIMTTDINITLKTFFECVMLFFACDFCRIANGLHSLFTFDLENLPESVQYLNPIITEDIIRYAIYLKEISYKVNSKVLKFMLTGYYDKNVPACVHNKMSEAYKTAKELIGWERLSICHTYDTPKSFSDTRNGNKSAYLNNKDTSTTAIVSERSKFNSNSKTNTVNIQQIVTPKNEVYEEIMEKKSKTLRNSCCVQ